MFKFQDTTCDPNAETCPEVVAEPVVINDTEPVVPLLMTVWLAVPILDLAAGVFNAVNYHYSAYRDDFQVLYTLDVVYGLVGLSAWVTANCLGSPLIFINIYSKVVVAWELTALYLEYSSL